MEIMNSQQNECCNWDLEQIEQSIINHSVNMAKSMLEIGKGLKAINDGEKYKEKGYTSFKAYMEDAAAHTFPFSYSQARKHIRVYERYGGLLADLNCAKIEVLDALRDIPNDDLEELSESGELEKMTKREAEELRDKLKAANEQTSLLTAELEEAKKGAEELERAEDGYKEKISDLYDKIRELENRPVETVIKDPTEEQISEIKAAAEKEAAKENKKLAAALKDVKSRMKELEAEHKAEVEKISQSLGADKAAADERIKELERKLQSAEKPADAELIEFKFYFAETQENLKKFMGTLAKIKDSDKKKKFTAAAIAFVTAIKNDLEEGSETE